MDLEGMLEKIPSTDKILGIIWILSWILAIWIYHIQFFLTGLFCLFLIFILLGKFDSKEERITYKPSAIFKMDRTSKALIVQKIYENDLKWEDHELCSGVANLPTGLMKEGDKIQNCEGNVALRHIPSNKIFGAYNFEE